jgi:hypothetical protein
MATLKFKLPDELLTALTCAPEETATAIRLAAAFCRAAESRPVRVHKRRIDGADQPWLRLGLSTPRRSF